MLLEDFCESKPILDKGLLFVGVVGMGGKAATFGIVHSCARIDRFRRGSDSAERSRFPGKGALRLGKKRTPLLHSCAFCAQFAVGCPPLVRYPGAVTYRDSFLEPQMRREGRDFADRSQFPGDRTFGLSRRGKRAPVCVPGDAQFRSIGRGNSEETKSRSNWSAALKRVSRKTRFLI